MNVVLDSQPNCVVNLQVELPSDKVATEWLSVAKDFQRQARIPGYRPGKAPQTLINTRFAKEIREEVQTKLLRQSLNEAIAMKKLRVLSVDKVENVEIGVDNTMRYLASVTTAPEFEIPDYSSISVEATLAPVSEEELDRLMESLREPHATFEAISDRALIFGDFAVVTYEGRMDGQLLAEALPKAPPQLQGRTNAWLLMDEGTLIPGFSKALEGMKIDEERSFTLDVPADFPLADIQGRQIAYGVTLHGVNVKTLPPFDDKLASEIEPGMTLPALRDRAREVLASRLAQDFENAKRNGALKHLLSQVTFDLPQRSVQSEVNNILRDIVRENQTRGVSDEELRDHQDELIGVAQQTARDRVKTTFLLLRIAEKEKITPTETDLLRVISQMAQRYEIPIKKLIADIKARDGIEPIREQILVSKALDLVVANVKVSEPKLLTS